MLKMFVLLSLHESICAFVFPSIDESLCLFGTPPKTTRRRSVLHRRPPTSVSQPITEEPVVPVVDMIFSLNPEASHVVSFVVSVLFF